MDPDSTRHRLASRHRDADEAALREFFGPTYRPRASGGCYTLEASLFHTSRRELEDTLGQLGVRDLPSLTRAGLRDPLVRELARRVRELRVSEDLLAAALDALDRRRCAETPGDGKKRGAAYGTLSGTRAAAPGRRRRRVGRTTALEPAHKRWLAERIRELLPIAVDVAHPMSEVAGHLIGTLIWRWTADGVDARGIVRVDGRKYAFEDLPHTAGARRAWTENGTRRVSRDGLRHEHVVPKAALKEVLLRDYADADLEPIVHLLDRFGVAAIVHDDEHGSLSSNAMPAEWRGTLRCDPWARYRRAQLHLVHRCWCGSNRCPAADRT